MHPKRSAFLVRLIARAMAVLAFIRAMASAHSPQSTKWRMSVTARDAASATGAGQSVPKDRQRPELILWPLRSTIATSSELVANVRQNKSELHRLLSEPVLCVDSGVPTMDYGSCGVGSSAELILVTLITTMNRRNVVPCPPRNEERSNTM